MSVKKKVGAIAAALTTICAMSAGVRDPSKRRHPSVRPALHRSFQQ